MELKNTKLMLSSRVKDQVIGRLIIEPPSVVDPNLKIIIRNPNLIMIESLSQVYPSALALSPKRPMFCLVAALHVFGTVCQ